MYVLAGKKFLNCLLKHAHTKCHSFVPLIYLHCLIKYAHTVISKTHVELIITVLFM